MGGQTRLSYVTAQVSLRIVPDQVLDAVCVALMQHLHESFDALRSSNIIKVNVDHTADWWLGDLTYPWFLELEHAIHDDWGAEPMRVREGSVRPFFRPSTLVVRSSPPAAA
ncbi:hypothetical protein BJV78DRAFT_1122784 [Lactifluus subvellereus]|nr:hypothetical protein BJV78DRAFT_1122784 [Lactifluus subvellereus]